MCVSRHTNHSFASGHPASHLFLKVRYKLKDLDPILNGFQSSMFIMESYTCHINDPVSLNR